MFFPHFVLGSGISGSEARVEENNYNNNNEQTNQTQKTFILKTSRYKKKKKTSSVSFLLPSVWCTVFWNFWNKRFLLLE